MSKHMIICHSNLKDDDNIAVYSKDPSYVVIADRTDLSNLKKIEESHKPGIYIFSGTIGYSGAYKTTLTSYCLVFYCIQNDKHRIF